MSNIKYDYSKGSLDGFDKNSKTEIENLCQDLVKRKGFSLLFDYLINEHLTSLLATKNKLGETVKFSDEYFRGGLDEVLMVKEIIINIANVKQSIDDNRRTDTKVE
jgi:hypothetical protein